MRNYLNYQKLQLPERVIVSYNRIFFHTLPESVVFIFFDYFYSRNNYTRDPLVRFMGDIKDFFSIKNTVNETPDQEQSQTSGYLEAIQSFARTTYKSIYVIDYKKKGFEYVSKNPLFLCGHTPDEVKEMGYEFYFKHVPKPDLDLLLKINSVGFEFYDQIPLNDRKRYTISYDFNIKNQEGKIILINQKLTPMFLTEQGKIWKAMCMVSLSSAREPGNIEIYKNGSNEIFKYSFDGDYWKKCKKIKLSSREKEILQLSTRGFTVNEIAESIFLSPDTVKFHRRKLFDKLQVNNISEAIMYTTNNKLI